MVVATGASSRGPFGEAGAALENDSGERIEQLVKEGDDAAVRGDFLVARDTLEEAAELGSSHAMMLLGILHEDHGDRQEAIRWHTLAIEAGHNRSLAYLGSVYRDSGNLSRAFTTLERGVRLGDTLSMINLGNLYRNRQMPDKAQELYERAAATGDLEAMTLLGDLHDNRGNPAEAVTWLTRAAEGGDVYAMVPLGAILRKQGEIRSALRWFESAARAGDSEGMAYVGLWHRGHGNHDEAISWFKRAVEAGYEDALVFLAAIHGYENPAEARIWADRAVAAGATGAAEARAKLDAPPGKNGCYIATAIYGSYEAEPVLVLRRFRDETLTPHRLGRFAVRLYYAISPKLAKHFGGVGIIQLAVRWLLDRFVNHLKHRSSSVRLAGEALHRHRRRRRGA